MHLPKFKIHLNSLLKIMVQFYQYFIGPFLQPRCRFYPTCSHYALEALDKKQTGEALRLIAKRLSSCHPFGNSGYDPIPD